MLWAVINLTNAELEGGAPFDAETYGEAVEEVLSTLPFVTLGKYEIVPLTEELDRKYRALDETA